jgi:hypothetical protein
MSRKTSVFGGLLLALTVPLVFGQEAQRPQAPPSPEDLLAASTELIAWSYLQKPKPVPEPLPPPDKGVPEPDQQAAPPPASQAPDQVQTQTFSGKIVKNGDKYVLKVSSGTSYQLEGQGDAKQYEDKDVKVVGTLDSSSNTIRVQKIELLS